MTCTITQHPGDVRLAGAGEATSERWPPSFAACVWTAQLSQLIPLEADFLGVTWSNLGHDFCDTQFPTEDMIFLYAE